MRPAGSGGSGGSNLPTCEPPISKANYRAFRLCPENTSMFNYEASGVLQEVTEPLPWSADCRAGGRRLTVQPATGAATSVVIHTTGEADISAALLPLVGKTVSIRAAFLNTAGHPWTSFLVSDTNGPLIYVVDSTSCPADVLANPPELAALTIERGADLCYDAIGMWGDAESRFVSDGQTLTLSPTAAGRMTIGALTYDIHVLSCWIQGPSFRGFDGYPTGSWIMKRVD